MPKLDFSSEDQTAIVARVQEYFLTEFELDVGRFEAEAMLEFFAAEIGAFVDAVEQGSPVPVGFDDGRQALILAEAAIRDALMKAMNIVTV